MLHAAQTEPSRSVSKRGSVFFNGTGRKLEGREAGRVDYSTNHKDTLPVSERVLRPAGPERESLREMGA